MSSFTVGLILFMSVMSFVLWNYYNHEKKQNDFLINRINYVSSTNENNKSKKRIEIEKKLEELNNPISYDKLMLYRNLAMSLPLILFTMLGMIYVGLLISLISIKIPDIYLSLEKDKRDAAFDEQFPDAINQLLAILQSNQTDVQGYATLAEEASYPLNIEFKKIDTDIKTGKYKKEALMDFYKRNPNSDTKLFVTGMIIANEASPMVAINTLKTVAETIKQRASQKKSAKSAIASGKYTSIILSVLPLVVFVGMETIMPLYINEFIATFAGKALIALAFLLDVIGYFIARRITSASKIVKY